MGTWQKGIPDFCKDDPFLLGQKAYFQGRTGSFREVDFPKKVYCILGLPPTQDAIVANKGLDWDSGA